jgi:hypothetical protein
VAVDTADKRASVIALHNHGRVLPIADATISADDRQHILRYRGIAATAPPTPTPSSYSRFLTDFAA